MVISPSTLLATFPGVFAGCLMVCLSLETLGVTKNNLSRSERQHLINELANEYWTPQKLARLLSHRSVQKIEELYSLNVKKPIELTNEKYKHFTDAYAMQKAARYQKKWDLNLTAAEKSYGVDKNIITAVLLVETSFGTFVGEHQLLSVFLTVYLETKNQLQQKNLTRRQVTRHTKKNLWALKELQAVLNLERYHKFDIINLRGSYAGAFGICQFLPSSYLKWAVSPKRGGAPNLFTSEDAIYSIANFLRQNGYRKDATAKQKDKAIWTYNNSSIYVETINRVAQRLQTHKGKRVR